jgi:hypothetical protein
LANVEDRAVIHAVFKNLDHLWAKALRALKAADLGLSVVVSGLFDHVEAVLQRSRGLGNPHREPVPGPLGKRRDRLPG